MKVKEAGGQEDPINFLWPVLILAFVFSVFSPRVADAASLYFSPTNGTYHKGENLEVSVLVDTDKDINAVSGVFKFPTRYLKVLNVRKDNSIINLWILEPSFSNSGDFGNVTFEGVILNPGFNGLKGKIISITFRVETEGFANLSFTKSSILASDGLGTNVVVASGETSFLLVPAKLVPPPTTEQKSAKVVTTSPTVLIREVPISDNTLRFWGTLPSWVRVSILTSVGITTIIFSFIVLSLGILVLIWLWSHLWHRRAQFFIFLKMFVKMLKYGWLRAVGFSRLAGKEMHGDVLYSIVQLKHELKKAKRAPTFRRLLKDYFILLGDITKRFFTKNVEVD